MSFSNEGQSSTMKCAYIYFKNKCGTKDKFQLQLLEDFGKYWLKDGLAIK